MSHSTENSRIHNTLNLYYKELNIIMILANIAYMNDSRLIAEWHRTHKAKDEKLFSTNMKDLL